MPKTKITSPTLKSHIVLNEAQLNHGKNEPSANKE